MTQQLDVGILIHQTPYSETSRLITWFTQENGILRTLAKGVSRKKSSFGVLDVFYECQLSYTLKSKTSLHNLISSQLILNHGQHLSSYPKQVSALYFFEVVEALVEKQTPIQEYYGIFRQALLYLHTHESSWKLIERYERKILELAGLNKPSDSLANLRKTAYHPVPKCLNLLKKVISI